MDAVLTLSRAFDSELIAFMLTLPRLYAFLAATQLLNASVLPGLPRTAAVFSIAFLAVPMNMEFAATFDRSVTSLSLYFAKEYAVGFLLGYLMGWIFWVISAAGGLIDNQRGAAIASSIDPLQGEEASTLGNLFSQAFLTFVFTTGGFLLVLGVVYKSYAVWPVANAVPLISDAFPKAMLAIFDNAMRLAVVIAGPIIAIMFLAEFSLAMISRFAPQIQIFILAMPIKSALAIMVLIFYFWMMLPFAERQLVSSEGYVAKLYEILTFGAAVKPPSRNAPAAPAAPPTSPETRP
jgi:type III secretion protein T